MFSIPTTLKFGEWTQVRLKGRLQPSGQPGRYMFSFKSKVSHYPAGMNEWLARNAVGPHRIILDIGFGEKAAVLTDVYVEQLFYERIPYRNLNVPSAILLREEKPWRWAEPNKHVSTGFLPMRGEFSEFLEFYKKAVAEGKINAGKQTQD